MAGRNRWVVLWGIFAPAAAWAEPLPVEPREVSRQSSVFFYVGQFSATRFNQIVRLDTDFQSSWVGILGATRELFHLGLYAHLEGEVNVAQHWGMQSHQEVNAGVVLRWKRFPWDRYWDTSFAFGSGISYAFQRPPIEATPETDPERLLKYMVTEIEGKRPDWDHWSLFMRIHHRSGVFGLVSDARGSNFVGLGVRRRY